MAKGDMRVLGQGGHSDVPSWTWQTEAGATDIKAGEPVKLKAAGSPYAIPLATLDLTIGTDTAMVGIAASDSSHTATADGTIDVYMPLPGTVWACKATTVANIDTQAKLNALVGDRVVVTLASSTYTIDENAGDGVNNAFYILGGVPETGEIYFSIRADATVLSGQSV